MSTNVIADPVQIPAWAKDFEGFRRWACSEAFPTQGWFAYLQGDLWVDLNLERFFHNQIKGAIGAVLFLLVSQHRLGRYLFDRMLLTHLEVLLSTEPDGMFISNEALETGRAMLIDGQDSLEIIGNPDMVLEVVIKTSVRKDTVIL